MTKLALAVRSKLPNRVTAGLGEIHVKMKIQACFAVCVNRRLLDSREELSKTGAVCLSRHIHQKPSRLECLHY